MDKISTTDICGFMFEGTLQKLSRCEASSYVIHMLNAETQKTGLYLFLLIVDKGQPFVYVTMDTVCGILCKHLIGLIA